MVQLYCGNAAVISLLCNGEILALLVRYPRSARVAEYSIVHLRAKHALTKQIILRNCGLVAYHLVLIAEILCAVEAQ